MPELSVVHIVLIAVALIVGIVAGWLYRGGRAGREKTAISSGWQQQIDAQRTEHDRLTEQNKGLMEQIAQYQASNKDAKNRARELSEALQEAFARRDELQRDIKDIRSNLEVSLSEREQLESNLQATTDTAALLADKDTEIAKLRSEIQKWQSRLPPLIERFRERNADATRLENELAEANVRIKELEIPRHDVDLQHTHTRIEPVRDPDALTDGRDASNDPLDTSALRESPQQRDRLQDIKGIGPAIEKTLNEMGIFRFQQIADMSEYDIDRVAQRLKGFRSRIYREDWIGQARDLHDQVGFH